MFSPAVAQRDEELFVGYDFRFRWEIVSHTKPLFQPNNLLAPLKAIG